MNPSATQPDADASLASGPAMPIEDEISLTEIVTVLLRHIRLIVFTPIAFALLAVLLTFVREGSYTAESTFTLTVNPTSSSRLSGLAAQFGIPVGGSGRPAESLDFYLTLLKSREVLRDVILSDYLVPAGPAATDSLRGTLLELGEFEGDSEEQRLERAIRSLREQISASANQMSGVVTIKTTARVPQLAEQINQRLLDFVNRFNIDLRASQASTERRFVEQRLAAAQSELTRAEEELSRFLSANRSFTAPSVAFEQGRLQHQVDLQRQVYLSLAQAYEQARIEEVRNTPLITVIDAPAGSTRPNGRLILKLMLAVIFGGSVAIGVAFATESVRNSRRADPAAFAEVDALRRSALRRVVLFWETGAQR